MRGWILWATGNGRLWITQFIRFRRLVPWMVAGILHLPGWTGSWDSPFSVVAQEAGEDPGKTLPAIEVRRDGSVLERGGGVARLMVGASKVACFDFGLPRSEPIERGYAEEIPSIVSSRWETGGIRYTQTVLTTRLIPERPSTWVLMVQLTGENISREYADATAAFALTLDDQIIELDWRHGLVHATNLPNQPLLGLIEIGAEGVDESAGARLKFRGHMPPGTSGAMTIKIPLDRVKGEEQINRLHDLEFDEEYRRTKRRWSSAVEAPPMPRIQLADP
jgi:hypothetical protein